MSTSETMEGQLLQEAEQPHFCDACGKELKAGDYIAHTYDMTRMWHADCLKPAQFSPKPVDPYDWCRTRPGETQLEARERMLANVPAGLKRNVSDPCPIASYFGYERRGG